LQGSYTGSVKDRIGKVELAEGGTLFLDEIDRTGQSIRNALITFVEDKIYEPLGGDEKKADVRLIFGTNKDIEDLISKGQFEDDFFARISHRIITIPPLRERKEDIPLIVEYTIKQQNEEKGTLIEIDNKAVDFLKKYDWPRNVRELMSYVSRVHTECLADGEFRITLERVQKSKLSSKNIITSDDYLEMIATLQKLLSSWDPAKGNFLDEIVKPVIAKLYIDDCFQHLGKQEKSDKATEIIGLSGGRGHDSIYYRFFEKYPEVREKLGL
jgi:transcriptional regulator with PAS, ATPase and Fis domain